MTYAHAFRATLARRGVLAAATALACLAAAATPAQPAPASAVPADAMLYDVEIVVFRASSAGAAEDWGIAPPDHGYGTPIMQGAVAPEVVRLLPSSDYRLDGIVRGLRASGTWYPIAHAAWVQTAPPWGTHIGVPLSQVGLDVPGLTGNIYLERAKVYLHLGFDVSLRNGATYTIDEMRNITQNEKDYFDHPAFGIIAVVAPIKRPAR